MATYLLITLITIPFTLGILGVAWLAWLYSNVEPLEDTDPDRD